MLHDIFQHILMITKWVWFQNIINLCSNMNVFYYSWTFVSGFNTVGVRHTHKEIDFHISNDLLKRKNWYIYWLMLILLGAKTTWHKHRFSYSIFVCNIINFPLLDILCWNGHLCVCFLFYQYVVHYALKNWNILYLITWKN